MCGKKKKIAIIGPALAGPAGAVPAPLILHTCTYVHVQSYMLSIEHTHLRSSRPTRDIFITSLFVCMYSTIHVL